MLENCRSEWCANCVFFYAALQNNWWLVNKKIVGLISLWGLGFHQLSSTIQMHSQVFSLEMDVSLCHKLATCNLPSHWNSWERLQHSHKADYKVSSNKNKTKQKMDERIDYIFFHTFWLQEVGIKVALWTVEALLNLRNVCKVFSFNVHSQSFWYI